MEETENNNNTDNIVSTEGEQIPTLPKETEESMPLKQNLKMHLVNDSKFDFYTSIFGVNPTAVTVSNGSITLTFDAQKTDMNVEVRVM